MLALWWQACRPKTLLISFAVIVLGNGLAFNPGISMPVFLLSLLTALLLQTAVNLANDYFDAQRGVDGPERLGPVRVTQSGLLPSDHVRNAMLLCLTLALAAGIALLMLAVHSGPLFWLAGVLSIAAVLAYSAGPWPLASNAMGEVSVFLFFGLLGVGGSYYLQLGDLPLRVYLAGAQLGAPIAAVMLVNNIRDINSDKAAGKYTLAVLLGEHKARRLYALLLLFPGVIQGLLTQSWLSLLPVLIMCVLGVLMSARLFNARDKALNVVLGQTSVLCVVFCGLILCAHHFY